MSKDSDPARRMLIVEDDPEHAALARVAACSAGFDVDECDTLFDAAVRLDASGTTSWSIGAWGEDSRGSTR
ncbi:MAG: hypothetical protein R3E53_20630 [Myxococcota bacterium]